MKRILSCFLIAASLAPAAHAVFVENFDGDTFPSYWRYDPEAGGKVDWRMGGGVATAVQMIGRPVAVLNTPFRVHDGGDFLFRARAGWDESPDTSFHFVLGNGPYVHAAIESEVWNGTRRIRAFRYTDGGAAVVTNVSPGWHDFEIEQKGRSLRFALDGKDFWNVDSEPAPSMGFELGLLNKDLEPFPPMYFDRFEVVPEPASLAALALGVGLLTRRKRRASHPCVKRRRLWIPKATLAICALISGMASAHPGPRQFGRGSIGQYAYPSAEVAIAINTSLLVASLPLPEARSAAVLRGSWETEQEFSTGSEPAARRRYGSDITPD